MALAGKTEMIYTVAADSSLHVAWVARVINCYDEPSLQESDKPLRNAERSGCGGPGGAVLSTSGRSGLNHVMLFLLCSTTNIFATSEIPHSGTHRLAHP